MPKPASKLINPWTVAGAVIVIGVILYWNWPIW